MSRRDEIEGLLLAAVRGGFLVVSDPKRKVPDRRHRLPSDRYKITDTASHKDWLPVIKWLDLVVGEGAVIVVDFDHPLRDLILVGSAILKMRYCLRFPAAPVRFSSPLVYAAISNAEAMLFTTSGVASEFHRNYFAPYRSARSFPQLLDLLEAPPGSTDDRPKHLPKRTPNKHDHPIRVLIVAYFSGPCRTVGVQRPNYWVEELAEVSGGSIEPHIVSTTDWGKSFENVHFVPDFNVAALLTLDGTYPSWATDFVAREMRDAKAFNTLSYYWRYAIEEYFDTTDDQFDVVIVSGNPFSCFEFGAYARRRWHARVILDYRDPFANNPRFHYTEEARDHAKYAERGLNYQADVISVVNDYCGDLVEGGFGADIVTIPNGFDERIATTVDPARLPDDKINIVHAGSFYHYGSPEHIVAGLDPERHVFHHVGDSGGVDPALLDAPAVVTHGRVPYEEALALVGGADLGVVFLSEQNFETTTKLFDYLAMGVDILLCTNGEVGTGALAGILDGQSNVYWCRNEPEDVARFLDEYRPQDRQDRRSIEKFSRRHGTELLAAKIAELAAG